MQDLQDKNMVVAYETADGLVSDAIEKTIKEGSSCLELKNYVEKRFGDVIDQHHGISLLIQCK